MEVVDVILGDEGVQRRVDRRHGAALAEPAVLVVADDVVLVDPRSMNGLEGPDAIEIEKGQPGSGHRPEIATRALDRQNPCGGSRDGVGEGHLRRRVATSEVGDTLVWHRGGWTGRARQRWSRHRPLLPAE